MAKLEQLRYDKACALSKRYKVYFALGKIGTVAL